MKLDKNTSLVWEYLKNHFSKSDTPVNSVDILATGLSIDDVFKSIDILESNGYLNVNDRYPSKPIESINL